MPATALVMTASRGVLMHEALAKLEPKSFKGSSFNSRNRVPHQPSLLVNCVPEWQLSGTHLNPLNIWPTVAPCLLATGLLLHHAKRSIQADGGGQLSCSELGPEGPPGIARELALDSTYCVKPTP